MNAFFQVNVEAGQYYYTLFYQLSFLIGFLLFLFIGIRRKYPLYSWLLLGTVATLFFIIGTKIGTYSWQEWKFLFTTGYLAPTAAKSLPTGLLLGLFAILLIKKWLNFKPSLLDAYALILPVAFIFQRMGCLLAGCCFGSPTDLPWGIEYASHYSINVHHIEAGLITPLAESSASVHPVPLYLILVYIVVLWFTWKKRNSWNHKGSLAIFSLIGLLSLRFVVEFFRDPVTNHALGETFLGLKELQWFLLLVVGLFSGWLFLRERFDFLIFEDTNKGSRGLQAHTIITFGLVLIVWLGKSWFTSTEIIVIHAYAVLILISLAFQVWKQRKQLQPQLSFLAILVVSLFFVNQTYDGKQLNNQDDTKERINTVTIGVRQADLDLSFVEREYREDGCDDQIVREDTILTQKAISGHFQFTHEHKKTDKKSTLLGVGVTYSNLDLTRNGRSDDIRSVGINLMYGTEWKNAGFLLGMGIGDYTSLSNYHTRELSNDKRIQSRLSESVLAPFIGLRLGQRDKLHFYGTAGVDLPNDALYSRYKFGLGVGAGLFKIDNNSVLRLGMAEAVDQTIFYLDADIALTDYLFLQPEARFGEYPSYGLGLSYRFY